MITLRIEDIGDRTVLVILFDGRQETVVFPWPNQDEIDEGSMLA